MAGVTSCLMSSSLKRNEEFAASFKLPYCQKTADELLLGLLDVVEEICFSDGELVDDEVFQGMDPEKYIHSSSYLELIGTNGKSNPLLYRIQKLTRLEETIDLGDYRQVGGTGQYCWSMEVNLNDEERRSERRDSPWFESFRDKAIVKVDTGENLRYCVQVFGSLLRALWNIVRSMFGYKEGFGN